MQGTHGVGVGRCLQLLGAHHSHRTCQVGLALSGVTCDNHFVELLGILLQLDNHIAAGLQLLSSIAYIGKYEWGALWRLE